MSKRRTDHSYVTPESFVDQKPDGYVRMRCKECGKKLKARIEFAGQMFTCRHCKTSNVLPFLNVDGIVVDTGPAKPELGRDATALSDWQEGERWASEVQKRITRIKEIDELLNSMFRVYRDSFTRAQNMLMDEDMEHARRREELTKARRDLDVQLRGLVIKTRDAMKSKVAKLRSHPMAKSAQIREQLDEAIRQHEAFSVFSECMLD